MPSYILTGAPGAGKTAVLRMLEVAGYAVVEEAATDVIMLGNALGRDEPWQDRDFIGKVLALQRQRQDAARADLGTVFFDRSPACTLALSRYLAAYTGTAPSPPLDGEVSALMARGGYETMVFFMRNLGFIQPTTARRISFEDSLAFERIHEETYRELGFSLVDVPAGPLAGRVDLIRQTVRAASVAVRSHRSSPRAEQAS
ncbi:ATPase [Trebonia kvetii]|uniref:ATPase n=1 Tax=Trebonia kvetii TaxID=2480626 RepID=A0A6P2C6I6_9ACTN|nr:AAA family ATPase [Trebonia kvetii]TVZ05133.1 ATPase [Trebonia kvetii]